MKLGIFGGTFDPVHNAHLFVAESARRLEGLERVLFLPTRNQHYRTQPAADVEHRCAMILAAIASNPHFALDETDLKSDSTGYTADLMPRLAAKYPNASFTFIIGADSLVKSEWVRLDEVLSALERFVVAPRAGIGPDALRRVVSAIPKSLRDRIRPLNLPELPESATLVRTLLSQGKTVRYLVPEPVWEYITAYGLYGMRADA
jgi:nicotinate-nucleotide adenylyltransferase